MVSVARISPMTDRRESVSFEFEVIIFGQTNTDDEAFGFKPHKILLQTNATVPTTDNFIYIHLNSKKKTFESPVTEVFSIVQNNPF